MQLDRATTETFSTHTTGPPYHQEPKRWGEESSSIGYASLTPPVVPLGVAALTPCACLAAKRFSAAEIACRPQRPGSASASHEVGALPGELADFKLDPALQIEFTTPTHVGHVNTTNPIVAAAAARMQQHVRPALQQPQLLSEVNSDETTQPGPITINLGDIGLVAAAAGVAGAAVLVDGNDPVRDDDGTWGQQGSQSVERVHLPGNTACANAHPRGIEATWGNSSQNLGDETWGIGTWASQNLDDGNWGPRTWGGDCAPLFDESTWGSGSRERGDQLTDWSFDSDLPDTMGGATSSKRGTWGQRSSASGTSTSSHGESGGPVDT